MFIENEFVFLKTNKADLRLVKKIDNLGFWLCENLANGVEKIIHESLFIKNDR